MMNTAGPEITPATAQSLDRAATLLRQGGLVAFPTETVYGLGANAFDDDAVERLYNAKGRPRNNPLIVHVTDLDAAEAFAEISETARAVAGQFWPGPLTLVLPLRPGSGLSSRATAGLDTVAVRAPSHPVAQALLSTVALPLVAPSANPSGRLSPTTPVHVRDGLGDAVDLILAGGRSDVGVESTVLDLSGVGPRILRPGAVLAEDIARLIGPLADDADDEAGDDAEAAGDAAAPPEPELLRAPGQMPSHYAPHLPLRMDAREASDREVFITFGRNPFLKGGSHRVSLSPEGDLEEAAQRLFSILHDADRPDLYSGIAVAPIPDQGLGLAINDRLRRAAAPRPEPKEDVEIPDGTDPKHPLTSD